jgi:hypothetical protein
MTMPNEYPYVEINQQYFCLNQNPVRLSWYLFNQSKSLNLRRAFIKKRKFAALKTLIRIYLGLETKYPVVRLPFFGHLVLNVHGGYRVFDFSRKVVTKVLNADSNPCDVMSEITGARTASQFDFAPDMLHWNVAEGWYEEELINGHIGYSLLNSDASVLLNIFDREIAQCLKKMILVEPPQKITVSEVVDQCGQTWEYDRLSRRKLNTEKVDVIYQFIQPIVSKLFTSPDQVVYRIITHGDFSLRNMLRTKKRFVIIDWESVAHRSVLFDLYNFFLTEIYYKRISSDLTSEIRAAILKLQAQINSKNPEIAHHLLAYAEVYRWLYYIERISMLLQRGFNDKTLEVVARSIHVFSEFEQAILNQQ